MFKASYTKLHEGRRKYMEFLGNLICSYMPKGRVLDIGCSYGFFLENLEKRGWKVFGMDVSKEYIERTKRRVNGEFTVQSADRRFPYGDGFFDAVTMFDVIEHVPNYKKSLMESFRVLKNKGFIFIITLNADSILKCIFRNNWSWYKDPTHIHLFSKDELVKNIKEAGFTVVSSRTVFLLFTAGDSTRLLKPLRFFKRAIFFPKIGDSILVVGKK